MEAVILPTPAELRTCPAEVRGGKVYATRDISPFTLVAPYPGKVYTHEAWARLFGGKDKWAQHTVVKRGSEIKQGYMVTIGKEGAKNQAIDPAFFDWRVTGPAPYLGQVPKSTEPNCITVINAAKGRVEYWVGRLGATRGEELTLCYNQQRCPKVPLIYVVYSDRVTRPLSLQRLAHYKRHGMLRRLAGITNTHAIKDLARAYDATMEVVPLGRALDVLNQHGGVGVLHNKLKRFGVRELMHDVYEGLKHHPHIKREARGTLGEVLFRGSDGESTGASDFELYKNNYPATKGRTWQWVPLTIENIRNGGTMNEKNGHVLASSRTAQRAVSAMETAFLTRKVRSRCVEGGHRVDTMVLMARAILPPHLLNINVRRALTPKRLASMVRELTDPELPPEVQELACAYLLNQWGARNPQHDINPITSFATNVLVRRGRGDQNTTVVQLVASSSRALVPRMCSRAPFGSGGRMVVEPSPQEVTRQTRMVRVRNLGNNRGRGVEAVTDIPPWTKVATYPGYVQPVSAVGSWSDKYAVAFPYQGTWDHEINPANPAGNLLERFSRWRKTGVGPFFNEPSIAGPNCVLVYNQNRGNLPEVWTFKAVQVGEELTFCYGQQYKSRNAYRSVCHSAPGVYIIPRGQSVPADASTLGVNVLRASGFTNADVHKRPANNNMTRGAGRKKVRSSL